MDYRSIWAGIALMLALPHVAAAQSLRLNSITTETKTITGSCKTGVSVAASVSHEPFSLDLPVAPCDNGAFRISLPMDLRHGDTITAHQESGGTTDRTSMAVSGDAREDFEVSGYLGFAIDTFAADEIQRYLNQTANAKPQERGVFGFDFAYRLINTTSTVARKSWTRQIWVYGKTVHGARSSDVDCEQNPAFPTCLDAKASLISLGQAVPSNALYMLRNATSLESHVGVRAELLTVNLSHEHPAALYIKGQLGFISVAGSDGDAKDAHRWAVGLTTTSGPLKGSYLEIGRGRTDLFATNRYKRYIFEGYLQQKIRSTPFSFFGQIVADVDMGRGADSIQPSFGLTFDLDQLFTGSK